MAKRVCCDYCGGSFNVQKYKYIGKTSDGKRKQITLDLCFDCDIYGIAYNKAKIAEIWLDDDVFTSTIESCNGVEMEEY